MKRILTLLTLILSVLVWSCNPPLSGENTATTNTYHCNIHTGETGMLILTNAVTNAPQGITNIVSILSNGFNPQILTIPHGSYVKWSNQGTNTHSVIADIGNFTNFGIDVGQYWTVKID